MRRPGIAGSKDARGDRQSGFARAVDPLRGFPAIGRTDRGGRGSRRRLHPSRRHGRRVRSQHQCRLSGPGGGARGNRPAYRRPLDDRRAGTLGGAVRRGRRRYDLHPRRSRPEPLPYAAHDRGIRRQPQRHTQSGDVDPDAGACHPHRAPGADHVGQPRLWRPDVHPRIAGPRQPRAGHAGGDEPRLPARSRRRDQAEQRAQGRRGRRRHAGRRLGRLRAGYAHRLRDVGAARGDRTGTRVGED